MPKINLTTGKSSTYTSEELNNLLSTDEPISDTNLYGQISATNISATKHFSGTKYMNEYKKQKYDTIRIDFAKGTKAFLKQEADKRGISLTRLIKTALKEYLDKENS